MCYSNNIYIFLIFLSLFFFFFTSNDLYINKYPIFFVFSLFFSPGFYGAKRANQIVNAIFNSDGNRFHVCFCSHLLFLFILSDLFYLSLRRSMSLLPSFSVGGE
jgi:hypothetical protein